MARKKAVETENRVIDQMEESLENIPVEKAAPGEGIQAEMENAEGTDPQPAEEVLLLDPPETENGEDAEMDREKEPENVSYKAMGEEESDENGTTQEEHLSDEIPSDEEWPEEDVETEEVRGEKKEESTEAIPPAAAAEAEEQEAPVLTVEAKGEVETEEVREDTIWHEIHNAYRTRRILSGQLGGVEQTDGGKTIAIVDYKGFRIVIPIKEMLVNPGSYPSGQAYTDLMTQYNKLLNNMLGAEIDFIVRGIDSKTRSVVASRREAMLKKRQIFYLDTDNDGMHRVYEGRLVQARVIAVAEKVVRVEIFGIDYPILARDLSWDWIGDARERFSVGDRVLVRILKVQRDEKPENVSVTADIKSVTGNAIWENLKKCRVQGKYAGKVADVYKGIVYIRLSNGVNAIAHSCYDSRTPGKKDDVSFVVTRIDEERGVAVGIITRIIRRNL